MRRAAKGAAWAGGSPTRSPGASAHFDGVYGPSDWDQRHILNLVATTKLGRGWSAGTRVHYNTGRPYSVETAYGVPEYARLPVFWQLDLRVNRRMVLDRATVNLYFELGNATFNREVTALERKVDMGPPTEVGFQHRSAVHWPARRVVRRDR